MKSIRASVIETLTKLKINDSFVIPMKHYSTVASIKSRIAFESDKKFVQRKLSDSEFRVWRVQ